MTGAPNILTGHATVSEPEWLEVRLAVRRSDGLPYVPWAALRTAVDRWRREGRFGLFFLIRKEPGLRLRFSGSALSTELDPVLRSWLDGTVAAGEAIGWERATYEPEEFRFGGPDGMALAHRVWDLDSRLVLAFEEAPAHRIPLWGATVCDLLAECVDDTAEQWDVWKRLQRQLPAAVSRPDRLSPFRDAGGAAPVEVYEGGPAFLQRLRPVERWILDEAGVGNRDAAAVLRRVDHAGDLTVGRRGWVTAMAVFQCNRWGLVQDRLALTRLVDGLVELLRPDGEGPSGPGPRSRRLPWPA